MIGFNRKINKFMRDLDLSQDQIITLFPNVFCVGIAKTMANLKAFW